MKRSLVLQRRRVLNLKMLVKILMGQKLSGLNNRQVKIWDYLIDHKRITAKECEQILPKIPRPTINYDLAKMQKRGLIHQLGETRGASYEANF